MQQKCCKLKGADHFSSRPLTMLLFAIAVIAFVATAHPVAVYHTDESAITSHHHDLQRETADVSAQNVDVQQLQPDDTEKQASHHHNEANSVQLSALHHSDSATSASASASADNDVDTASSFVRLAFSKLSDALGLVMGPADTDTASPAPPVRMRAAQ